MEKLEQSSPQTDAAQDTVPMCSSFQHLYLCCFKSGIFHVSVHVAEHGNTQIVLGLTFFLLETERVT